MFQHTDTQSGIQSYARLAKNNGRKLKKKQFFKTNDSFA